MAYDGELKFDTGIDTTGFQKGISTLSSLAKSGLDGISSLASTGLSLVQSSVNATIDAMKGLGDVATNLAKSGMTVGMEFESSMSQVMATMGITKDTIVDGVNQYELLNETAKEMGATTQFSASQAGDALNYLALAGYDAEKACGALPTVLNIAAAGGMELADASDMVTDAMSALGIEATSQNLEEFGDKLAKTAQKSNTSVAQLGEAILTVGGTAKTLAGGVTEMNTALGILADNGIKGSEGGTALRNMILSLGAPTDVTKQALDDLGVSIYDTSGNMRPLNEIFSDLNVAMKDMTQEQKNIALNDIFNKVDLKSANAMLANCGERWDELSGYINDSKGACEDMAETMNDNLQGRITILQSALEGLGVSFYENVEKDAKTGVESVTSAVDKLNTAMSSGGLVSFASSIGDVLNSMLTDNSDLAQSAIKTGTNILGV